MRYAITSQDHASRRNKLTNILIHVLRGLPQPIQAGLVTLVIAVGEVETGYVHPRLNHLLELRHVPARRAEGAEDLRPPVADGAGVLDGVERDVPPR